jgi:hypothetical protein
MQAERKARHQSVAEPEAQAGPQRKPKAPVINIRDALKKSIQKQGRPTCSTGATPPRRSAA